MKKTKVFFFLGNIFCAFFLIGEECRAVWTFFVYAEPPHPSAPHGAKTMETGPIRNQNLMASGQKIGQQKNKNCPQIYGVPANQFSPSAGTTLFPNEALKRASSSTLIYSYFKPQQSRSSSSMEDHASPLDSSMDAFDGPTPEHELVR